MLLCIPSASGMRSLYKKGSGVFHQEQTGGVEK